MPKILTIFDLAKIIDQSKDLEALELELAKNLSN
jgi:hypothetical protein